MNEYLETLIEILIQAEEDLLMKIEKEAENDGNHDI